MDNVNEVTNKNKNCKTKIGPCQYKGTYFKGDDNRGNAYLQYED